MMSPSKKAQRWITTWEAHGSNTELARLWLQRPLASGRLYPFHYRDCDVRANVCSCVLFQVCVPQAAGAVQPG